MNAKVNPFYKKTTLNVGGKMLDLSTPQVMGILNVTPDSFFDGGQHNNTNQILAQAGKMIEEGAAIIDIGGYSSRPGADDISPEMEEERVCQATESILASYPEAVLSIDTFRASVARAALDLGAGIINDISAGQLDENMFPLLIEKNCPYIMMHMRGTPKTMSSLTDYDDIYSEMLNYFGERLQHLEKHGVTDLIVDPGFGFAKSMEQNYDLLKNLNYFQVMEVPLLVGLSRKSMFYKLLGTSPDEALNATTAAHMVALNNGASILRVHDVKEAKEAIEIFKQTVK